MRIRSSHSGRAGFSVTGSGPSNSGSGSGLVLQERDRDRAPKPKSEVLDLVLENRLRREWLERDCMRPQKKPA